jgi:regulator of sirC expression with transglutaminase-like and TPR domain
MRPDASDPTDYLRRLGLAGEGPYEIARAGLMLAALDHPHAPLARYEAHLDEVAHTCRDALKLAIRVEDAAHALSAELSGRFGYEGDRLSYDDPVNADLMSVIDRRRGLPVALGVLYLHGARAGGLDAAGLNTPAHFLLRITFKGASALIDPFNGGQLVDRERLGTPPAMSATAPDEPFFGEPVSDADVLLRLQNNIKLRALKSGDDARALAIAERMVLVAPARAELWFELAHLRERAGSLGAAKHAYENCLTHAQSGAALHNEAALALASLKRRLN